MIYEITYLNNIIHLPIDSITIKTSKYSGKIDEITLVINSKPFTYKVRGQELQFVNFDLDGIIKSINTISNGYEIYIENILNNITKITIKEFLN